jgi:16S rRNA (adenine1518-N6/adenine1519-N6)-dimethyltransferase
MDCHPKRRLGQHFLTDSGVLNRLVRLIQPSASDLFVEVGAGSGPLSSRLAASGARLLAIELDRDLVPLLTTALSPYPEAFIVHGDILALDVESLVRDQLAGRNLRGAGNLPYNIATAIIEKLLYSALPWQDLVFLVQQEVAERIAAVPGTRQYGILSVQCQYRAEARTGFQVKAGSFRPPPQVMSSLVILRPRSDPRDTEIEARLLEVTRAAFAHRRKTLLNSLRRDTAIGDNAGRLLEQAGIDGSLRPEQLSVHDYESLARAWQQQAANTGRANRERPSRSHAILQLPPKGRRGGKP